MSDEAITLGDSGIVIERSYLKGKGHHLRITSQRDLKTVLEPFVDYDAQKEARFFTTEMRDMGKTEPKGIDVLLPYHNEHLSIGDCLLRYQVPPGKRVADVLGKRLNEELGRETHLAELVEAYYSST